MDSLGDLLLVGFACWQVVEIWHHSQLTLALRTRLQDSERGWSASGSGLWVRRLLSCPFCLSVWAAGVLYLLLPHGRWLLFALAASRLANLGNDLCHDWCRTPRHDVASTEVEGDEEVSDGSR